MSTASTGKADTGPASSTMRVYTRALRVPALVGKLPGGGYLPFGPYSMTQFVGGALVLVAGLSKADAVLPWGWLTNRAVVLAVAVGVVLVLGLVKPGGRDPVSAALGVLGVYGAPRAGRSGGRPVRLARPHQVRHRVFAEVPDGTLPVPPHPHNQPLNQLLEQLPDEQPVPVQSVPAPPPATSGAGGSADPHPRPVAPSGVARLLAQAAASPTAPHGQARSTS